MGNEIYFSWEMYAIICISYIFGFIGGWAHGWVLPFSLFFLIYPFYKADKVRRKRKEKKQ